jgi:BREX system ATP-binding protein BrxC/D
VIPATAYAEFLEREYLDGFVADGGAAVKFLVPADEHEAGVFSTAFEHAARQGGYELVEVDAADVRIHLMDQVFFEIARRLDWDRLARHAVAAAYAAAAYPVGDDGDLTVGAVAVRYGVDPSELTRDVSRQLQATVYRDFGMVTEFRTAMLRLCQAVLGTGQVTDAEAAAVLDWLRGDLRQMSLLRSAMIFRRIGRHNARQLLFSLAHWLRSNGRSGLVLCLDVRRLGFARRPAPEERNGLYYTKAALLDGYEMLRQLVDNSDELSHCLIVVTAAQEFLSDPLRGVDAYQALKLRIADEVRDRRRDNPFASLVRLGTS